MVLPNKTFFLSLKNFFTKLICEEKMGQVKWMNFNKWTNFTIKWELNSRQTWTIRVHEKMIFCVRKKMNFCVHKKTNFHVRKKTNFHVHKKTNFSCSQENELFMFARKRTSVFSRTRKFLFQGIFYVEPHSIRLRHVTNNLSIKEENSGIEFNFFFITKQQRWSKFYLFYP